MTDAVDEITEFLKKVRPKDYKNIPKDDPIWENLVDRFGFENTIKFMISHEYAIVRCKWESMYKTHEGHCYMVGEEWRTIRSSSLNDILERYRCNDTTCPLCNIKRKK
jgi:hypothetical protein